MYRGGAAFFFTARTENWKKALSNWEKTPITRICCTGFAQCAFARNTEFAEWCSGLVVVSVKMFKLHNILQIWQIGLLRNCCALRNSITTRIIAFANLEMNLTRYGTRHYEQICSFCWVQRRYQREPYRMILTHETSFACILLYSGVSGDAQQGLFKTRRQIQHGNWANSFILAAIMNLGLKWSKLRF